MLFRNQVKGLYYNIVITILP